MSIEALIKVLTEALDKNTEASTALTKAIADFGKKMDVVVIPAETPAVVDKPKSTDRDGTGYVDRALKAVDNVAKDVTVKVADAPQDVQQVEVVTDDDIRDVARKLLAKPNGRETIMSLVAEFKALAGGGDEFKTVVNTPQKFRPKLMARINKILSDDVVG